MLYTFNIEGYVLQLTMSVRIVKVLSVIDFCSSLQTEDHTGNNEHNEDQHKNDNYSHHNSKSSASQSTETRSCTGKERNQNEN